MRDLAEQVVRVAALAIHLLMNVVIGTSRRRHTSNSLRVCASMPCCVDHHHRRVDGGQRAMVSSRNLAARRVEQVERAVAVVERFTTDVVTEMPRSRSTFIQSERARRRSPRALTAPASWIAPPKSSSFSVSVVFPASGCAMMAHVRRFAICTGNSSDGDVANLPSFGGATLLWGLYSGTARRGIGKLCDWGEHPVYCSLV